jgi:hypothetical protein
MQPCKAQDRRSSRGPQSGISWTTALGGFETCGIGGLLEVLGRSDGDHCEDEQGVPHGCMLALDSSLLCPITE